MKKIITSILIFMCVKTNAQVFLATDSSVILGSFILDENDNEEKYRIISKYDTTVLNAGNINCPHNYVAQKQKYKSLGCAVYHGAIGCPDYWDNRNEICKTCLRHINIKEIRSIEYLPKPKDEYNEALEMLNKKNKQ